ncbi:hypothetical protein KTU01_37060 [Kocuria turfanensis]|uniref:Uncharacterized protein n=1 Tax=Kocuria turfanensis TaxID=388357 RepID=A0A512IIP1_9MICC|nr:hypothetical protein KTU01_37060 [Kocuria turfanensis]
MLSAGSMAPSRLASSVGGTQAPLLGARTGVEETLVTVDGNRQKTTAPAQPTEENPGISWPARGVMLG